MSGGQMSFPQKVKRKSERNLEKKVTYIGSHKTEEREKGKGEEDDGRRERKKLGMRRWDGEMDEG